MNKLITLLSLLAALTSATALATPVYDDESVDCFYAENTANPLCKK
jgi:hypothetical protein